MSEKTETVELCSGTFEIAFLNRAVLYLLYINDGIRIKKGDYLNINVILKLC